MQVTPRTTETPVEQEAVYEPPMLVEIGGFADVTHGSESRPSDFPYWKSGYWLI